MLNNQTHAVQAYRASVLHFINDPNHDPRSTVWFEDGVLVISDGKVVAVGDYHQLQTTFPENIEIKDYRGKLIIPGFIDTHLHFPQTDMIASPANGLLPWLNQYTFPTERQFADPLHAQQVARFFIDELLRCGTTTAMVYCSVHPESVEALFAESAARNLRMVAGKCMMDRNCPTFLQDRVEQSALETEQIIKKWHRHGRQLVAITPRFAASSSDEQLQLAGELARRYPDVYLQTHVAENVDEVAWIKSLFPNARSYLDVYDQYGLLRPKAMYAHGIWLDDADRARLAQTASAVAVCPTSNLFLGSGLFDFQRADVHNVLLSLGIDVGAGTSFSMLQTMNEAYKVARMNGAHLSGLRLFYFNTFGKNHRLQTVTLTLNVLTHARLGGAV